MVTRWQFQILLLLCTVLVLSAITFLFIARPQFQAIEEDELAFSPTVLDYGSSPTILDTSVLRTHYFQGPPVKPSVIDGNKSKKSAAPKLRLPSETLKIVGILIDTDQPQNAQVLLSQPDSAGWLSIGDSLSGEFPKWKIQSIDLNSVSVGFETIRDRIIREPEGEK